jgi:glycosyltransferase involved in cell wall biosynthesis
MRITVMTNLEALAQTRLAGVDLQVLTHPRGHAGAVARGRALWRALSCDYILINCSPRDLFEICLLKLVLPFSRCKVVSLDTVLPVPRTAGIAQRASLRIKKLLFSRVHLFIEYFRETQGYVRHYGISAGKFRYVPFKVNRYERVLQTRTRDDGYIFCGGNTRRDFGTLIEAARGLPYPIRIVTMADSVIAGHGSFLDAGDLPANVEVIRHDGSDSFLDHIAAARLVVLPIRKENISASGIGVYLASMALGKCVVISAGPAVNGVVPEGAAIIVPAEDPDALRAALARAYADDGYRATVAEAGRRYAHELKGEERLCESVLRTLLADSKVH